MNETTSAANGRRALVTAARALAVVVLIGGFFIWMAGREQKQRAQIALEAGVVPYSFAEIKQVIDQESKPVLLFLYASWCDYCKKDVPLIEQLVKEKGDRLKILAVSIDGEPDKLGHFVREQKLSFTPYNISAPKDRDRLDSQLGEYGLRYGRHIPYLAAFRGGRPVLEVNGVLEKQVFDDMVAGIEQTGAPSSADTAPKTE